MQGDSDDEINQLRTAALLSKPTNVRSVFTVHVVNFMDVYLILKHRFSEFQGLKTR